jgi:uncharacterized protein YcfL
MRTFLALFLALIGVGCASTDSATLLVPSDEPKGFTLISVSPSLQRSAEPTEIRRGFAEDGVTPKFSVLLQNTTSSAQRLNYRVEWLDTQDMPLRGQIDVARQLTIPAGSVQSVVSVAPNSKAKRFRLWLTDVGGADATR